MLFLMFRVGKDRYALDVDQIEQVLPFLDARELPGAPAGVAGIISFHGSPVPLIDLGALATGRPCAALMSTRIILVRYPLGEGASRLLGLAAEHVIDTIARDPSEFVPTGVEAGTPAYLGPVASDADGLLQWVRAEALLTEDLRAVLFRAEAASP